jgi:hypothetical protein
MNQGVRNEEANGQWNKRKDGQNCVQLRDLEAITKLTERKPPQFLILFFVQHNSPQKYFIFHTQMGA